jgi:hypothetical protein
MKIRLIILAAAILLSIAASPCALASEPTPLPEPQILNGSFEEPVVAGELPFLTPSVPQHAEPLKEAGWAFGFSTGICRAQEGYAEGLSASDGRQVAFLQGDQQLSPNPYEPWNILGINITGLEPGQEYEVSWDQAGRATDLGTSALRVTVGPPASSGKPAIQLVDREPVTSKGAWEEVSRRFTATGEVMTLNFNHFIVESGNPDAGSESTLIDNVQIRKVANP